MSQALHVSLQQDQPILLDVNFSCEPGKMLALVGPSGSGKSTVLRTIAGLHTAGHANVSCGTQTWLDSQAGIDVSPQARRVGMVFQHYALFPHKSAVENVMLAIHELPRTLRRQRALEWLARTNMTGLEQRKPHELSGGQRQRVALARALAREPAVLLLDEPFSAVDQQTRRKLYRELAQLRVDLPIPIVLVTHDIGEVQQLADSLCLIHRGKTLQRGPVQQVINAPLNRDIAKLLGHQNLMQAKVIKHGPITTTYQLESDVKLAGARTDLAVDTPVTLLISPMAVSVIDPDSVEQRNLLFGSVTDAVALGDELSVRLHLNQVTKSLRFRLPLHKANAAGVCAGAALGVTIRDDGIHAIAAESQAAAAPRK